jgi:ferredoxin
MAPVQFQMSKKDGKSVLIHSKNAKGFYTLKSYDHTIVESCELAVKACPVKIISVKET